VLQFLLSLLIVSFGQPVWSWWLGSVAAVVGYALFFKTLLAYDKPWHRFSLGVLFGMGVQLVQLSWLLSHPYWYIYFVHFGLSLLAGFQVGLFSLLIVKKRVESILGTLALAGLWTIMEWSRLFFLAGFSLNQAGLALSGNIYSLQMASLWGVFGLSFWVVLVNLFTLRFWIERKNGWTLALLACLPYLYGMAQLHFIKSEEKPPFEILLVQTAFPAEETFGFQTRREMVNYVLGEWKQIFTILKKHAGKTVDLVVLPEGTVPFGTYSFVFELSQVQEMLKGIYGEALKEILPKMELPWVYKGHVNNAYLSQTIANLFQSGVLIGLEDASDVENERRYYSAAQHFQPGRLANRYEKRVLVPMGEYIPFSCVAGLCSSYGIYGSLTRGSAAKIMQQGETRFGVSICYEETFGHMMRENRELGADLLVNITSDVWYPNSKLPQVHFDHAKLRTVEMGIPLVRACNTGVTGAIDCFGKNIAILGEGAKDQEWLSEALYVTVPMKTYWTLYSIVGDWFIISLCFLFAMLPFFFRIA
jgi:apolipoprotein N-acyltransferase